MACRQEKYVLIGGGLAGGLLAAYLGQSGCEVELFERRGDPSAGNFVGGRSINLALSTRGIRALERIGLAEEVLRQAIPMRGRMIHDPSGKLHFSPYDRDPNRCIHSIGRAALNTATLAAARRLPGVRVHFHHVCTDVDLDNARARLTHSQTGQTVEVAGHALFGVDGAFSAVRRTMQRLDRFDCSQQYLEHGYKELTIPPAADGSWKMEKNALHIWPRRSFMMIALPNPDGSFTCTLFWPFEGPRSFATLRSDDDVRRLFEEEFPDAVPLMPHLLEEFRSNPTGSLVTIRCRPWHYRDKVVLVGDAAHAVVPFYGQGMNAAFEDCLVLDECLRRFAHDRAEAFEQYEQMRRPNTDALADLAVANFIEMRDRTASRWFRAKKRLDHALEAVLPGVYRPLYQMVTFSQIPYAVAARRARLQDRIVYTTLTVAVVVLLGCLAGMLLAQSG
ncbi:MAG: FAD-dependent monooxygenase [Phycisphaerae bacterium]|nr:FAD-dependent monooxygenase [Phycisphaerae bacterium]MDW8261559.1 NAD(P)/FAD-dependent oxidoreductase [Phycisphaerales bacterium]